MNIQGITKIRGYKMTKVIIDTDIGDDIDDVLAIALALKCPELDLIGITTVFRNTSLRNKIALKLLNIVGRLDIPVVAGLEKPLLDRCIIPFIKTIDTDETPCQYQADMGNESENYRGNAVDFIIEKLETSEEKITLLCIGPLTNIAAVLIKCPKVKSKIEKIVLMGGAYTFHAAEYNIQLDPEAARIVFESEVDILAVGLDVTLKCKLSDDDIGLLKRNQNSISKFLYKMIELWGGEYLYLHDALAVAVIADPSIVRIERKKVAIETSGEYTRGMTYCLNELDKFWGSENKSFNSSVCIDVDDKRFIELFLNRILDNTHSANKEIEMHEQNN